MRFSIPIPPKLRKPLIIAGYVGFALLSFLVAVYVSFPYDKVKDRLEAEISTSSGYELQIGRLGPSPLLGVKAKDVVLQQRAPAPGGKPGLRLTADSVRVSASLFWAAIGRPVIDFTLEALGGKIAGVYAQGGSDVELKLRVSSVNLSALAGLAGSLGIPLAGSLSAKVDLVLPKGKLSQAKGALQFHYAIVESEKAPLLLTPANRWVMVMAMIMKF